MKKTRVQKIKQAFDIYTSTYLVMAHLFRYPTVEFSLSEIAEKTRLSKATVSRIIRELRGQEIVTIVDLDVVYRIRANTDGWVYRREKIAYNIQRIIRSNVVEFLAKHFNNPKCIILMGSFRRGEDGMTSDIDIAVEVADEIEPKDMHFEEFTDFEENIGRKVQVHVFNRKNVDDNVFLNMANGMVLYGLLEVSK
jgi:predicted nucleotidyltransferase